MLVSERVSEPYLPLACSRYKREIEVLNYLHVTGNSTRRSIFVRGR